MSNTRLSILFQLYLANQARPEEKAELKSLLADPANDEEAKALMGQAWEEFVPANRVFSAERSHRMLHHILNVEEPPVLPVRSVWNSRKIWSMAASLFIVISCALLFFVESDKPSASKTIKVAHTPLEKKMPDAAPGGNKAMLTLADGTRITLDDASNGKIASQSGISITKAADGQLIYTLSDAGTKKQPLGESQINTISTPKGGQYQVNLPDGSKVWLNAASTLKFPAIFEADERRVELTGEAYFEIQALNNKSVRLPFKVISSEAGKRQVVEVLGTHFNINAYANERVMKTTLLEGSVKVTNVNAEASNILKPGQQAILKAKQIKVATVDLEEVMAWKHGNFRFNNLRLVEIMKQLERWYDVEVGYADLPDIRYQGFISKSVTLSQVLEMLELTGSVKFRITVAADGKGKKIEIKK